MNMQSTNRSIRTDIIYGITGLAAGAALLIAGQQVWLNAASQGPTVDLAAEAQVMGLPLTGDSPVYWYVARSGGIIAYLLLWLATIWGIVMSSKMMKGLISAPLIYSMHEFFPLLAVIFATVHALVLLGDAYINFSLLNILIPFTGPYKPLWTSMGSVAFYLSVALLISSYIRDRIGRKTWRMLHYSAFIAFVAAMMHGIMAGSDTSLPLMRGIYLFTGLSVLFATIFRILTAKPRRKRKPASHHYQLSPQPELAVQRVPHGRK